MVCGTAEGRRSVAAGLKVGLLLLYNIESVRARWRSTLVAVLGIAGTVGVFVAMLSLAHGLQAALVTSGSPDNAMIRRAGATSEIDSMITLEQLRVIEDAAEVARDAAGPLVSAEVVAVAALPLKKSGTDANVQLRGIGPRALAVHEGVHIVEGRFLRLGLYELLAGRSARESYANLTLGSSVRFGDATWQVVGIFDAGGSSFDSEVWADADLVNRTYQRPLGINQTVSARLVSRGALASLKNRFASDPRMRVQVERETEYYAKASEMMTTLIRVLGGMVAAVMGIGAVFAALNTMYSAVAERAREVATLRALGFPGRTIVLSFTFEALLVAGSGGLLGALATLPLNGLVTSTLNFQTFSHLAFAFRLTPGLLLAGFGFALVMGLMGGVPPALRAARLPVTVALRDL
jgi:putative ABC transport system permease protein